MTTAGVIVALLLFMLHVARLTYALLYTDETPLARGASILAIACYAFGAYGVLSMWYAR